MKARTDGITFKLKNIRDNKIRFDENFGPGTNFSKGEETIFLNDCYRKKLNIYSFPIVLARVENEKSTWFEGFNTKFFYDQGAIFSRISQKKYKILIIQYIIRKYKLYKNNFKIKEIYKIMIDGAIKQRSQKQK